MILTSDEGTWAETPESQKCIENWEEYVSLNADPLDIPTNF